MSNPQQPELARSRKTPHQDPDSVAGTVSPGGPLDPEGPAGPVPPENQPGHHPSEEQDKPDLDAFAERLGAKADAGTTPSGTVTGTDVGRPPSPLASSPLTRFSTTAVGRAVAIVMAVAFLGLARTRRRRRRSR